MQHTTPNCYFLRTFENDLGSWLETKLDSQVSTHSVEAMNAILWKDGITAYIGMRSEYGLLESVLRELREADTTRCWTSLQEAQLHSVLGLSESTSTDSGRSLVLYGSPRTLLLSSLMEPWVKSLDAASYDTNIDVVNEFVFEQMPSRYIDLLTLGYNETEVKQAQDDYRYFFDEVVHAQNNVYHNSFSKLSDAWNFDGD